MVIQFLLVAHIAVFGYWLGAEFVINYMARVVALGIHMPFAERDRLWTHVLNVDQHVRYALILQAILGPLLALAYGLIPGGEPAMWSVALIGLCWIAFIEVTHHLRQGALGRRLGLVDRWSRYGLAVLLVALALGLVWADWDMPLWLRWKLGLFAGVILSGVSIRLAVLRHFRTWAVMAREGETDARNAEIARSYWLATAGVGSVWLFIFAIVAVSVVKPV